MRSTRSRKLCRIRRRESCVDLEHELLRRLLAALQCQARAGFIKARETLAVGRNKAEVLAAYLGTICPDVEVASSSVFCGEETFADVAPVAGADRPDLVIDAIDSLNPKVQLLCG